MHAITIKYKSWKNKKKCVWRFNMARSPRRNAAFFYIEKTKQMLKLSPYNEIFPTIETPQNFSSNVAWKYR